MNRLPIAKTELREIVEQDCLYVDKTHFVKMLVEDNHKYYFLSRPRRFGKSLFIDTLRAAFAGEKELFKGLYLENNWDWGKKHPVIKISFGTGSRHNVEELKNGIRYIIKSQAEIHQVELSEKEIPDRFHELIKEINQKTENEVVVLIDEYDKPLLDNLTKDIAHEIREELSSFYSVLKDASKYLKFVFLTGVSKFSKTSIFSKLNNLTDISLVPKYADICGITHIEFESTFCDYLKDKDLNKIKEWYDGYNFLGSQLYNPYDVLMFLWDGRYKPYWFETGTPTFLLNLIKDKKYFIPELNEIEIYETQLSEFDLKNIQLEVLLFQTGYLAIKNKTEFGIKTSYTLKFPNIEVQTEFNDFLLNMFYAASVSTHERTGLAKNLFLGITNKNPEQIYKAFQSLFAGISHQWFTKNNIESFEGFYCSMFYVFFASLGLHIVNEDTTNKGRIDFTVSTNDCIYIFEIKMKRIKQNALQQIKGKKYSEKYLSDGKQIFIIGIEFDEEERNISEFEWEQVALL